MEHNTSVDGGRIMVLLCEGPGCNHGSDAIERERVAALHALDATSAEDRRRAERARIARAHVSTPHRFVRSDSGVECYRRIYACTVCGRERIYGVVAKQFGPYEDVA